MVQCHHRMSLLPQACNNMQWRFFENALLCTPAFMPCFLAPLCCLRESAAMQ